MKTVKTLLIEEYEYPHEHSRHAIFAVLATSLFFISTDNMHTLVHKLDKNIKWWSIYAFLLGFFYFFSSPFLGRTIQPSYSNFSRWYVAWLLIAAVYHLPSFHTMGVDIRMNLSLFLTLFLASVLALLAFHVTFLGLWYIGLAARLAGKRPEFPIILQNSTVLSIACCVFYSHCGNTAALKGRTKSFGRQWSSSLLFEDAISWNLTAFNVGWPQMHQAKEQVCNNWLGPVGSAHDYPVFSKWVLYGELVCNESCVDASDNISPVFSLWATFIGLYVANYVVERSTGIWVNLIGSVFGCLYPMLYMGSEPYIGHVDWLLSLYSGLSCLFIAGLLLLEWALTHPDPDPEALQQSTETSPEFLDMVPWYSGTSADLFKTAFDLLVSVTLFLGRFDMRTMQAAMTQAQQHNEKKHQIFTQFSVKKELWFDFMADTGDGGNSTYGVARLLAQPYLQVPDNEGHYRTLPRGNLMIVGGDLAYPNPSTFSYEERFFRPFQYALQPPPWYKAEHIAVQKPELPEGLKSLHEYDGPQCFAIPGNHDWFDGLDTFMRYICHRSWLGGWLMPQEKSYFTLQLPHGWWIFGLDQALHGDIDVFQFKYFTDVIKDHVKTEDSVIVVTHEPNWLLDWYWGGLTGKNVAHLIKDHLNGRCRLRLAGDLHHFMRHSALPSPTAPAVQHLLVNGCGGAFLHPTHVFAGFRQSQGSYYEKMAAYPSFDDSRKIALGNILKFRKKNWRFDVIGGIVYFILVFSMFPQCHLDSVIQDDSMMGHFQQFWTTMGNAFVDMLEHSYISVAGFLILSTLSILFVPVKVSRRKRVIIGLLHVAAHLSAAMILMLLLELGIETCVRHQLLGNAGYHTLYEWYHSKENEHFPDPTGLRARIEFWTLGLYPACIKYLMAAFDIPEVMAVTRSTICKNGLDILPRGFAIAYYVSVFLYYWVFSTPVVSLVFGSYLYVCVNWFHLHFDEAYSSLRIANYKSFTRCHLTAKGDLEVNTLAVDKVPKEWALDPHWEAEQASEKEIKSHIREYPSQWTPVGLYRDRNSNVRVIDKFVIERLPLKDEPTQS